MTRRRAARQARNVVRKEGSRRVQRHNLKELRAKEKTARQISRTAGKAGKRPIGETIADLAGQAIEFLHPQTQQLETGIAMSNGSIVTPSAEAITFTPTQNPDAELKVNSEGKAEIVQDGPIKTVVKSLFS